MAQVKKETYFHNYDVIHYKGTWAAKLNSNISFFFWQRQTFLSQWYPKDYHLSFLPYTSVIVVDGMVHGYFYRSRHSTKFFILTSEFMLSLSFDESII